MYNYNYDVSYLHIKGDIGDTTYRKHLLGACNLNNWEDDIIKIQDDIYDKFKNNKKFKNLIQKGKKYGFNLPFELDDKWIMSMFFSFNFYETFHECLKDLYNNNEISDDNFTKMIKGDSYKMLIDHIGHEIIEIDNDEKRALYEVVILGPDKKYFKFRWQVEKFLKDGPLKNCWLTTVVSQPIPLGSST